MAFFGSLFKRSQMENRILGAVLMLTGFALKRLLDPVIHGKNSPAYTARAVRTRRIAVVLYWNGQLVWTPALGV